MEVEDKKLFDFAGHEVFIHAPDGIVHLHFKGNSPLEVAQNSASHFGWITDSQEVEECDFYERADIMVRFDDPEQDPRLFMFKKVERKTAFRLKVSFEVELQRMKSGESLDNFLFSEEWMAGNAPTETDQEAFMRVFCSAESNGDISNVVVVEVAE